MRMSSYLCLLLLFFSPSPLQMVASEGSGGGDGGVQGGGLGRDAPEAGTALSKLRHTLTSGIHGTGESRERMSELIF